jgi:cysteine desulfuration protein SufE
MNAEINQIIEDFDTFNDWQEKYFYIIDLGKKLPKLEESQRIDANKIIGCVSQVWLVSTKKKEKYYFGADSDAFIVKGLLAIVLRIFSGKTKEQILNNNFHELFNNLGLATHLTPSRSNGLFSIVKKIISIASV